ncbi:Protein NOI4, partial [Bienertia sinuspersici]
ANNARGRPLPKFGEWDVNNPSSAEGFTVIFNKARDQKKTNGTAVGGMGGAPQRFDHEINHKKQQLHHKQDYGHKQNLDDQQRPQKKWLCCFVAR